MVIQTVPGMNLLYSLRWFAVSSLSQDGNDCPGVDLLLSQRSPEFVHRSVKINLEGLGFEIAKGNGLVIVGVIKALDRADGLRSGRVVAEIVWERTEILPMYQ